MKKGNRIFVLFTATALLMQSLGCSPALAAQSVTDRAYSAVVDSQAIVTAETTAEEVYVYGLSKEDKEEKKAAKKEEKEEEKAAKKAQKEAIKQAKEQYKYEKKVQKKKVKENSVKDSEVEWNLQMVNTENASQETGRKIKLALIDSGVDYTDDIDVKLRKNFVPGHEEVSILYEDISGHGTSVAGILAAKDNGEGITGINPNLELYSAKVLDENRKAPVSRVVDAIYWAVENNVDIINISFGTTTDSEELYEAIRAAYDAGILIVAAAGNSEVVEYPAAYGEVIAVGSVDNMGNRSEGSAVGDALELVAPGELILSTGAFYGVAVFSGTSMASPHVAGIASLLWEKDSDCSADFIRFLLASTANLYGNPEEFGNGVVDYEEALSQYDELKAAYEEAEASGVDTADYIELADVLPVEYNDSEIDVFGDLDYVEGSWKSGERYDPDLPLSPTNQPGHLQLAGVESSVSNHPLSTEGMAVVKVGALINDKHLLDMTERPEWHGYTSKRPGGVREYWCNYVASYIYITEIASAMEDGVSPTSVSPTVTIGTNERNGIQSYLSSDGIIDKNGNLQSWTSLLNPIGQTVNNRTKSLLVYGMALHTVTDMFAHSTRERVGQTNQYAIISHPEADYVEYVDARWNKATEMASHVIAHIKRAEAGSVNDYLQVIDDFGTNPSFKVVNLSNNIRAVDPAHYNQYSTYYNNANLTVQ